MIAPSLMGDISGRLYARESPACGMIAGGHVSPSDYSLSSSMILDALSRLKGPFILFITRLFRAGKVRRKAFGEMSGACLLYVLANVNGWLQGDRWSDCVYEIERGYIWNKLLDTLDDVSYKIHFFMLFKSCNFFDYCKYMFLNFSVFVLAIIFYFPFFFLFMKELYWKKLNFKIFIMYFVTYFHKREIISLCLLIWQNLKHILFNTVSPWGCRKEWTRVIVNK